MSQRSLLVFLCIVVALLGLGRPHSALAQGPIGTTSDEEVTLEQLGFQPLVLSGPFGNAELTFGLPTDWEFTGNAVLQLTLDVAIVASPAVGGGAAPAAPATLQLALNGVWLDTVLLDQSGDRVVPIPLPDAALASAGSDQLHTLRVLLLEESVAGAEQRTSVVVEPASRLLLPHRVLSPATDLRYLPLPLYQNSFLPDTATVVVPDAPAPEELQAALIIAAGLGRMSDDNLLLSLLPVSQLSAAERSSTHLIFVGQATALPPLADVDLPAPASADGFAAPDAEATDGIVQMVASPWNSSKVLLVVGGNSPPAVVKSALALSTGDIVTSADPSLAVVAEVRATTPPATIAVDQTLAGLGFQIQTLDQLGENTAEINFFIPPQLTAGTDAYLDLAFNHSTALDYADSQLVVELNGTPLRSIRLNDGTADLSTTRLLLPRSALRAGNNQLMVRANLVPSESGSQGGDSQLWLTIWPESLLHLPLTPAPARDAAAFELGEFPALFTHSPSLSDVAFVLAPNDVAGWRVALALAAQLGAATDGGVVDLAVAYGNAVPDAVRAERDLIVIGRASALPLIAELGPALPAPFEANSDIVAQEHTRVAFRVAPGTSLGYLQTLAAPWNRERAILAILGTTDEGIEWAGKALLVPRLREQLGGSFSLVSGEQIIPDATPDGAPSLTGGLNVAPPALDAAPAPQQRQFAWVLPLFALSLLLMLFVLGFVAISSLRRRLNPSA